MDRRQTCDKHLSEIKLAQYFDADVRPCSYVFKWRNRVPYKVWDEITYPFPNFNCSH